MGDRRQAALARARQVLAVVAPEIVEKTIWASPAGKKRLANRLAAMLPAHRTYVEPFRRTRRRRTQRGIPGV